MKFDLVDRVIEAPADGVIVTLKNVSSAEEYLGDHFPSFPVLPGVMMLEALVQAARLLAKAEGAEGRLVLGEAKALKYGRFVRPGESLRVRVERKGEPGSLTFKGEGTLVGAGGEAGGVAVSGRLTLRALALGAAEQAGMRNGPAA